MHLLRCPYEAAQLSHLRRHAETHQILKRFPCHLCDFSANTASYMKQHYTRHHPGIIYAGGDGGCGDGDGLANVGVMTAGVDAPSSVRILHCMSCDYRFGNMSDMRRHLKVRHQIYLKDVEGLTRALDDEECVVVGADGARQEFDSDDQVRI